MSGMAALVDELADKQVEIAITVYAPDADGNRKALVTIGHEGNSIVELCDMSDVMNPLLERLWSRFSTISTSGAATDKPVLLTKPDDAEAPDLGMDDFTL
jgi:hypothetical protein